MGPVSPSDTLAASAAPQDVPGSDGRVAFLSQALWRQLGEAQSPEAFAAAWLELQCRIIGDVVAGVVVLGPVDKGPFRPTSVVPADGQAPPRLLSVAERAMAERRGVAQPSKDGYAAITYPLLIDARLHGVVGLELKGTDPKQLRKRMRELQWGVQALEYALYRHHASSEIERKARVHQALELLAKSIEEPRFDAAAIALVTELGNRLDCERVALGFRVRGRTKVRSLSNSAQFGKRMNLVRLIANAMDEAIDQVAIVVHPASEHDEPQLDRAHVELATTSGAAYILTVPFASGERMLGALLLERSDAGPFTSEEIDAVECVGSVVGPVLDDKRRNDRLLLFKAGESAIEQSQRLLGPRYFGRKLLVLAGAAVVAFLAFATDTYRITADAALEGTVQRAVIAAFDGYVVAEHARAGDVVRSGQPLAQLDDRDLILERSRRIAEREELAAEYSRALASGDRAMVNILREQMAQSAAQIGLVEEQIARASIRAPYDGVVVKGDLSQVVGAAVRRGDELFTIAPLDSYRVILNVDESEVASVEIGQTGTLVLASLPNEPLPIVVERLTPVAEANEGRTSFRVEARMETLTERLRPGMQGIAKVEVDERRLIWIWTRGLIDWLRLAIWRYWH
jgi:RND family efflux transporter MFP subunit